MTVIATVLAHLRLARLTPYLLAVLAAVVACLLLGNHSAFAGERTGSQPARAHLEAAPRHEVEHARQPQAEEATASPVHQLVARVDRPAGPPPVAAPARRQAAQVDRPAGPPQVAAPIHHEAAPVERPAAPPTVAAPPPVLAAASGRPAHREPYVERPPAPAATRLESGGASRPAPALTMLSAAAGPSATTARWHHKAGLEHPDRDDVAPQLQPQSGDDEEAAPGSRTTAPAPEAALTAAPQRTTEAACLPPAEDSREPSPAPQQVHQARTHGSASGVAIRLNHASVRPFRQPGIALVAQPTEALAPILSMAPPAIGLPAPSTLLPNPPPALQPSPAAEPRSAPTPAHQAVLSGNPLVGRLQSAVTVGALWLPVPLLALVLLLQVRLMRQMHSLTAAPTEPATRHYSLTHQEVRELAPDMLPALAHHRFCETERHQGRWRPARWMELEDDGSDPLLMWATCETCHHQRMTRLRSGQEVAISRP
jgi:hypothetical protein